MDLKKYSDEQIEIAMKVIEAAEKNGINPDFVLPMVAAESGFNPKARSKAGAIGVMQLMPGTAGDLGVDPEDVDQNIEGGIRYLKRLSEMPALKGDSSRILAAYNAGPGNKFFEDGDYSHLQDETVDHVYKVSENAGGDLPPVLAGDQQQSGEEEPDNEGAPSVYGATPVPDYVKNERKGEMSDRDIAGLLGAAGGFGAGSLYEAKAPVFYLLKKLGLINAGKVSDEDLSKLAEKVIASKENPVEEVAPKPAKSPGDKWSEKVVGGMGPGGEGVTEAAKNYRTQRDLTPQEASKWRVDRGGLLLPNELEHFPMELPQDVANREAAEAAAAEARAAEEAARAPKPPGAIRRGAATTGRVVGRIAGSKPVIGGLAGYNAMTNAQDLYEAAKKKDYLGAGISGTGAASSIASFSNRLNPAASFVAAGADTARRAREGDISGAAVSGISGMSPWLLRALMGAEIGGPLGTVVSMGGPLLYDAMRYKAQQEAERIPRSIEEARQNLAMYGTSPYGGLP